VEQVQLMQQTGNMPSHQYARLAAKWVPGTGPYNQVTSSLDRSPQIHGPLPPSTPNPGHPSYVSPFMYNHHPPHNFQYPNPYHQQYYPLPAGQSATHDQYYHLPTGQSSAPDEYRLKIRSDRNDDSNSHCTYGITAPGANHVDESDRVSDE
jgi:hypothetical protein